MQSNRFCLDRNQLSLCPEKLERDGFVILRKFFDPAQVLQARTELIAWFDQDIQERQAKSVYTRAYAGSHGESYLDPGKHLLINVFTKSSSLNALVDQLLTHPDIVKTLEWAVGKYYKLRGYNVRRMTGTSHLSSMDWHRDNRGEFNFGIIIEDTGPDDDASTSFIPGSHYFPYCPDKETLISVPRSQTPKLKRKFGVISKMLAKKTIREEMAGYGDLGDAYLFFGDIWHGRQSNLNGKKGMVLLFAVFPSEMPFPDEVLVPPEEVLQQMPRSLQKIVCHKQIPENADCNSFAYTMEARRVNMSSSALWKLAQLERRAVDIVSLPLEHGLRNFKEFLSPRIKPLLKKLKGT